MDLVNYLYEQLHTDYKITQYDYSRTWLKKDKSYFAYLKSSKSKASIDVLVAILGEAIKQRNIWEESARQKRGTDKDFYQRRADYFSEIESTAYNAIRQQALTM